MKKSLSFRQHMDKSEMLIRGMNVVVLNEVTGAVMSSRWYDTYESLHDSRLLLDHLQGLRLGRILCFAIKVSATVSCKNILGFFGVVVDFLFLILLHTFVY